MEKLNTYQREQHQALVQVREKLNLMGTDAIARLNADIEPYLEFRRKIQHVMDAHMGGHCTRACFESRTSACCSRDGIITFWADVVINAVQCTPEELDTIALAVKKPLRADKCIFLGTAGCLWRVRPLVCAMFVCDHLQADVINPDPDLSAKWHRYGEQAKAFRWPDRPVLFDRLELLFMDLGCRSPLMYLNTSPGLLRIKEKAGLMTPSGR